MAEWKTIDELFDYEKGSLQSSKCTPGKYTFITAAAEWKTHETFTHDCEALIFAMAASGSLGRTHYANGKFISSDLCFILTPKKGLRLDLTFYHRLFNFLRADIVKKTATGTSKLAINQTNFGAYELPYFEYEHQLSFRNKIETIRGINEEFFDGMDSQLSLLDKLRQAVLQEAIEGKLTLEWRKQNPKLIGAENHASKLLERIRAEKNRLVTIGKKHEEKPLPPITDDDTPFALPDGWIWCRLGDIIVELRYGTSKMCDYDVKGTPVLRIPNVSSGRLLLDDLKYTRLSEHERDSLRLRKGDILLIRSNGSSSLVGRALLTDSRVSDYAYAGYLVRLRYVQLYLSGAYVVRILNSNFIRNQIEPFLRTTTGVKNINSSEIFNLVFPLPPLSEQQAIDEQTEELMDMIDTLETQVSGRKDQAEMLMQSVLREAFEHSHVVQKEVCHEL